MATSSHKSLSDTRAGNVRAIAELAGCSPSTVSRVLSGNYGNVRVGKPLREKIRKICKDLGYEPNIHASRMFSKRTGVVGLVIPYGGHDGLHDENLSFFTNEVYETLNAADCRLLLLMLNERFIERQDYLSLARRREVDGLIVWGAVGDTGWLDELAAVGMPLILGTNRAGNHPCVYSDDHVGMAALVDHCRSRGAARFAYVDGTPVDSALRRREGFLAAVVDSPYQILPGDFSLESGREAAATLVEATDKGLPDAVICSNDRVALGVIMGLRQAGLSVPEDIMVTGVDNTDLSKFAHPSLTTYDQMNRDCGRICAERLLENQDKGTPITGEILPPDIFIRESA